MTGAVVIGASGGIGRALVDALAAEGGGRTVFAFSRSGSSFSRPIHSGQIDLADETSIAAAAEAVARVGPPDLVMIASGILHQTGVSPEKSLRSLDPTAMATVFAVNTIGPALVAKHFFPLMPRTGRSVFAALSARVGSIEDNRLGGWYTYRASKAALNQILRTLAIEARRTHPDAIVAGLHPGTVATALSRPFRPDTDAPGLFTPEVSASHLLRVLADLKPGDSGRVFAWNRQQISA
ncbi:short-chain dehydrogenase [Methylobacterium sp. Leaf104]|uniref:SDR family NAD(P)-dependent oxidoreductase n=1 Tax=Methylobacterium TaxID=407 RepID=UPI0006F26C26|nr:MULTISPECIES: SDR family NAD(P)-dependent oxidoreductase [Methylobacterium]KQP30915.1 short-chain dehydrogenase [Methylobacterium sp. Leaf104]MCI9879215.1 SDR family NAD(P)-dependent oxidoreductase [Methylobacterium goesingense]